MNKVYGELKEEMATATEGEEGGEICRHCWVSRLARREKFAYSLENFPWDF